MPVDIGSLGSAQTGGVATSVIPTNSITVILGKSPGQTVEYANLVGNTYATLATYTYGGLQNLASTNAELVVLPTNAVTVYLSVIKTAATWTSIYNQFGTVYSAINGKTYGQLSVVA